MKQQEPDNGHSWLMPNTGADDPRWEKLLDRHLASENVAIVAMASFRHAWIL